MPYVLSGPEVGADLLFPDTLPPPTISGYSNTYSEAGRRTERDQGHDRYRLEFTNAPRLESVTWDFSEEEYQTFEFWYRNYCQNGTLRFDIQLSDYSGGLAWSQAMFTEEQYSAENLQPSFRWRVSANLILFGLPFILRSGPAELFGRAYLRSRATGLLYVDNILHGDSLISMRATGALEVEVGVSGRASMSNSAVLRDSPSLLYGRASMSSEATYYDGLELWAYDETDFVSHDGAGPAVV